MPYTQDDRPISVKTPLGKDVLLLRSFEGQESLSRLFRFELDMLSEQGGLSPASLLGEAVSFRVRSPGGEERYFHGHINHFSYVGQGDRLHMYRAAVVPWFWFLTRTSDCRTFQEKTVPEIIQEVLDEMGYSGKYEIRLNGDYRPWEYCIQYRETDFNFLSRLMEHSGIFYYFIYSENDHKMIIADQNGAFETSSDSSVKFQKNLSQTELENPILEWNHSHEHKAGQWAHSDYNFQKPKTDLKAKSRGNTLKSESKFEFFDYPGEYPEKKDGEQEIQLRMQEEDAGHNRVFGRGTSRFFSPGYQFTMTEHPEDSEANQKYTITTVQHSAHMGGSYVTDQVGVHRIYENSFTCIPEAVPYRAPRLTPRPTISGILTAIVVGKDGEEIWPDEYGRVKVQFYWDRYGGNNEKSSCWVRVATPWAGANWGMVHIPRIGQEVVVSFVAGNPDRPLITGMVYNALNMPPYSLAENKTQSGIKTRSSMGGSPDNFNELRFEDKKDKEQIYFHAERDFDRVVENNDSVRVGFDKKDKGDQTIDIFNNQVSHIGCSECEDGSQVSEIWNNQTLTIKKGNQRTVCELGKSEHEAMQSIELKVGASSIKLTPTGITIKSPLIKVEATGKAELVSPMTTVKGDATLTLKGGIVTIN